MKKLTKPDENDPEPLVGIEGRRLAFRTNLQSPDMPEGYKAHIEIISFGLVTPVKS
jgi:hypothetical protein